MAALVADDRILARVQACLADNVAGEKTTSWLLSGALRSAAVLIGWDFDTTRLEVLSVLLFFFSLALKLLFLALLALTLLHLALPNRLDCIFAQLLICADFRSLPLEVVLEIVALRLVLAVPVQVLSVLHDALTDSHGREALC